VPEPRDLHSRDGVLRLELTLRSVKAPDGSWRYCYLLADGAEAPTLRVHPGDLLVLKLRNALAATASAESATPAATAGPCTSGAMSATATNLHFHGLAVPPRCHEDEVLKTSIAAGTAPFEYRLRIPVAAPPGLYWYHPHIHGFSSRQLLGGASGALIIEGLERANRAVAGLPERVLVIRDQNLMNSDAPPAPSEPVVPRLLIDRDGDSANNGTGFGRPAKDLSVNFVPVPYPNYPPAVLRLRPGERQLWRVLNASAFTYLNLALLFGREPQALGIVALDGVAINRAGGDAATIAWRDHIGIPPGGRAEFIVTGPPLGVPGLLVTHTVDTGQGGENDPNRALAVVIAAKDAPEPHSTLPRSTEPLAAPALPWLGAVAPSRVRRLYFSERLKDPANPNSADAFYITPEGAQPAPFDPSVANLTVRQGDVEDWIIENRSRELHAFHIHQIHFLLLDWSGVPVDEPFLRDTVNVPYFNGKTLQYPSVRLRMDFRDPGTVGTFPYHCHLLEHQDGGMMGVVRVEPAANTGAPLAGAARPHSPIKHLIVIIGENRSFDHVFATYVPKSGETIWNLLSEGIVKRDGTPGPNFALAQQRAASDAAADAFLISPPQHSFPRNVMPAPLVGGPKDSYVAGKSLALAQQSENGLPPEYYPYLISGGTGLAAKTPDTRIKDVESLPPGPFQLTNGKSLLYDSYAASPAHRFYQMWQQLDCSVEHATPRRPSGCDSALVAWVEVTAGAGSNGAPQPANFGTDFKPGGVTTGEGSTALGFYNVQTGDVPYFKSLADQYAMSDNFHQSVNGGTGANHIMLGHGDLIWYSDGAGHPLTPPHGDAAAPGATGRGKVDQIENPNAAAGTNNWYRQDGEQGGAYTDCSDPTQPGVAAIVNYLRSLPRPIDPHCESGHYYLLNNYNPGYFADGTNAFTDRNPKNTVYTVPPSSLRSIGDSLLASGISWKYYGGDWNNYLGDPYMLNESVMGAKSNYYCNICNPFQYQTSIMPDAAVRTAHLQDSENLYADIANGTLPAVSFVKPSMLVDGHPDSSKLNLFEGFSKKIVDAVKANPELWKDTAIIITFDEGGGYYDSGYVQPLDYFGDGTRIPFIVVSPYVRPGHISHDYTDHVSILKFIERNWGLAPLTARSRDNLPNPISAQPNPYVPLNTPAIGDLFDLLDFAGAMAH